MCSPRPVLVSSMDRFSLFLEGSNEHVIVSLSHPFLLEQTQWLFAGGQGAQCQAVSVNTWAAVVVALSLQWKDLLCLMQSHRAVGTGSDTDHLLKWAVAAAAPKTMARLQSLPSPFHYTCLWDLCWVGNTYPLITPPSSLPDSRWNCF